MPSIRPRSASTNIEHEPTPKRQKVDPIASSSEDYVSAFIPGLFEEPTVQKLADTYEASEPYKHAVLDALVDDALLRKVKDEILGELRFAEKETDIYKVHQTGDLASLNFLTPEQLALFPSLLRLRNAFYSPSFRSFLRRVTGCGPLSGTKQDMSVNSYRQGCHLLNHDDVIGTRRVSYILYMPLAGRGATGWADEWGGALELYPVSRPGEGKLPEPAPIPSKRIPPAWNQFVFFEVQPGQSFHSVEEVVVGMGEDKEGRQRLSISGWFHMAQPGEEGYEEDRAQDRTERLQSSLEQLTASAPAALLPYPSPLSDFRPSTPLTEEELSFLSDYLNPVYLQPRSLILLSRQFADESSLNLKDFLCEPLAERLEHAIRERDSEDGLGPERVRKIPPHDSGVGQGWKLTGPPHKHRYCVLDPEGSEPAPPLGVDADATALLKTLQDELLPSPAFRAWLGLVTALVPLNHQVQARRFRPGLDYTLAQAEEEEARLDVTLSLTPKPGPKVTGKGKGKAIERREEENGWATCEWGGWECYMAPHEGEEDPAVYKSGGGASGAGKSGQMNGAAPNGKGKVREMREMEVGDMHEHEMGPNEDVPPIPGRGSVDGEDEEAEVDVVSDDDDDDDDEGGLVIAEEDREAYEEALAMEEADRRANGAGSSEEVEVDDDDDDDEEEDETGTLLTAPASFNGLLLVLRDPKLMRFVKYVSAAAEGSRWDVCGEWQVGRLESDDDEDDEDDDEDDEDDDYDDY